MKMKVVEGPKGGELFYLVNGPAMGRVAGQRNGAAQVIQVSSGSIFQLRRVGPARTSAICTSTVRTMRHGACRVASAGVQSSPRL